jgi:hypothetical protein
VSDAIVNTRLVSAALVPRAGLALKRHVIEINGKNTKRALCVSGKVSGAFLQCPIKALNMSE